MVNPCLRILSPCGKNLADVDVRRSSTTTHAATSISRYLWLWLQHSHSHHRLLRSYLCNGHGKSQLAEHMCLREITIPWLQLPEPGLQLYKLYLSNTIEHIVNS